MSPPLTFASTSPRFALPLLFPGQAQKEVFVNETHALVDALLHCAIEGEATDPPGTPENGKAWLVAGPATGAWTGQEGMIACRQADNWLFVAPVDGMRLFDRSAGQDRRYMAGWHTAITLSEPNGGSTVDTEARVAINALIATLRSAGILPAV